MIPLPSPPPLPVVDGTIAAQIISDQQSQEEQKNNGLSPSIMIVTGIIAFVFITSASIHLLLRYLSYRRYLRHNRHERSYSFSSSASLSSTVNVPQPHDRDQKALIESLPLFTLASSVVPLPKSTPDCAVCLSKFEPQEQLRLLPACRHAFHSSCIDTWLRSTPSCPLCRSSVVVPVPSPNPITNSNLGNSRSERSGSFRLEIGSVSRRREGTVPSTEGGVALVRGGGRSYSLGSSFEYVVEEEIDAVVTAVAAHVRNSSKDNESASVLAGPTEREEMLAAEVAAGRNGSDRWWLKDYVDRLSSSASSSFSSMRFSGRWTRRSETSTTAATVTGGGIAGVGSWDLEGGNISSGRMGEDFAVYLSLYRWLVGV